MFRDLFSSNPNWTLFSISASGCLPAGLVSGLPVCSETPAEVTAALQGIFFWNAMVSPNLRASFTLLLILCSLYSLAWNKQYRQVQNSGVVNILPSSWGIQSVDILFYHSEVWLHTIIQFSINVKLFLTLVGRVRNLLFSL